MGLIAQSGKSGQTMTMTNRWTQGATLICALLIGSGGALAKQESMPSSLRYINQVSALSCEDIAESWQNEVCAGAEMRLRLCEKGLIAEPALSPVVYQCFLRSQ